MLDAPCGASELNIPRNRNGREIRALPNFDRIVSMNQQRRSFFWRVAAVFGIAAPAMAEYIDSGNVGHGTIGDQAGDGPMMALGYLSRILPGDYVHCQPPMKLAEDITAHVERIKDELYRREVALAGVTCAALGGTAEPATAEQWAWHPAYQDTVELRRKFDMVCRMLGERIPSGQQIMLYPCGCSALGNLPDGEWLPLMCGSKGHSNGAASIVRGPDPKPRPTIAELEALLASDADGVSVIVLPNGEVRTC